MNWALVLCQKVVYLSKTPLTPKSGEVDDHTAPMEAANEPKKFRKENEGQFVTCQQYDLPQAAMTSIASGQFGK